MNDFDTNEILQLTGYKVKERDTVTKNIVIENSSGAVKTITPAELNVLLNAKKLTSGVIPLDTTSTNVSSPYYLEVEFSFGDKVYYTGKDLGYSDNKSEAKAFKKLEQATHTAIKVANKCKYAFIHVCGTKVVAQDGAVDIEDYKIAEENDVFSDKSDDSNTETVVDDDDIFARNN
ncbi:MAG: hypothetical protein J6A59_01140 [Lachnospiraceae bacterium]|nr:hypothetical protein [Lachnospiraceae bacterium]